MAKSSESVRDFNGNSRAVLNKILSALPLGQCDEILKRVRYVDLPASTVLNEAGEPIKLAYFINSGLASILNVMNDGNIVEVGLCGSEGFIGVPLLAGFKTSSSRVIMQIGGSGFAIRAPDLIRGLKDCPALPLLITRFGQHLAFQTSQVAACNRLHGLLERLARCLLMSQDRVGGPLISLTHEFLSHMLSSRRAGVSEAANGLRQKGLISYQRGKVTVRDRQGLERASCECYAALARQREKWQLELAPS